MKKSSFTLTELLIVFFGLAFVIFLIVVAVHYFAKLW